MAPVYKIVAKNGLPFAVLREARANVTPTHINLRCPHCMVMGAFAPFDVADVAVYPQAAALPFQAGLRVCPNRECRGVVFVVLYANELVNVTPPETIDFDAAGLPTKILEPLEEAIKCHSAGCYRAATVMVRRLLEVLCDDQNAGGGNLYARIQSLGATIVIPHAMITLAHELRILGNDAVHLELQVYDNVGKEEATLALEIAKDLLKAIYQKNRLLEGLDRLKKAKAAATT